MWGLRSSGLGSLIKSLHKQNTSEPKKGRFVRLRKKKKDLPFWPRFFFPLLSFAHKHNTEVGVSCTPRAACPSNVLIPPLVFFFFRMFVCL